MTTTARTVDLPRVLPSAAAAVAAGIAVGAATSAGQTLLGDSSAAGLANAVSPWLVVPFLAGSRAGGRGAAAALSVLACAAEVVGYYVTAALRGFGVGSTWLGVWLVAAVLAGTVVGVAGLS